MASLADLLFTDGDKRWKAASAKPKADNRLPKARTKLLEKIDETIKQLRTDHNNAPKRAWWSTAGDVARIQAKAGKGAGVALPVFPGKDATVAYCPAERAADVYGLLRAEVEAGKHDEALRAIYLPAVNGGGQVQSSRSRGDDSGTVAVRKKRGPVSDETRAKMRAARQLRAERERAAKGA